MIVNQRLKRELKVSKEKWIESFNRLMKEAQTIDENNMNNMNNMNNKGKDMRNLDQDRSNQSVAKHFNNFTQWANDRKIIENGNILAQGLKLVSEVGELSDNLAKGRCIKDDVGDCCVVLNNLAQMQGLTLNECLEQAWLDIKDRKGTMNEYGVFIKQGDE